MTCNGSRDVSCRTVCSEKWNGALVVYCAGGTRSSAAATAVRASDSRAASRNGSELLEWTHATYARLIRGSYAARSW